MSRLLIYDSYLKMIKNAVGTKMFRNLYLEKEGRKIDITKNGSKEGYFSCAFFVSNVLLLWGLISKGHATVESTIKDIKKNGWKKIPKNKVKPGDVIVWEKTPAPDGTLHLHNGFYIGNKKAISNDSEKGMPVIHKWEFGGKRKIIAIYTHSRLKA